MFGRTSHAQPTFGFGFSLTPVVKKLLIANVVMFFVTTVSWSMAGFDLAGLLAFRADRVVLQFWGAFTYMFVHGSIGHLLINMLVLFFFGAPLESRWGGKEFFRFYLISGLGGVALSFIFAPGAPIIGASAACYGLMLAFAMNWPKAPIYIYAIFPVQARFLVGFLFLMDLFSGIAGRSAGDGVAYFAHLGGFLAAFLYLKADWRPARFGRSVSDSVKSKTRSKAKPRHLVVVSREEGKKPKAQGASGRASEPDERKMLDEVDRVLDKISAEGMASLTPAEKQLLDEVSKRRRTN